MCSREAVGARVPVSSPQEKTSRLSGPKGIGARRQMLEQVAHIESAAAQQACHRRFRHRTARAAPIAEIDMEQIAEYRVSMRIVHGVARLSAIYGLMLKTGPLSCIYSLSLI
jgi:hypothetical protein